MYPKEIELNEKIDLKLGIKSSLPKAKQCIGLLFLIWKSSGEKFEYSYTDISEDKLVIKEDIFNNILAYLDNLEVLDKGIDVFKEKVNNNYLFRSQIESLKVAFELVWKICIFEFEDGSKPYSAERTGGVRYKKKVKYTKNMDIVNTVIMTSEKEYVEVLYNWVMESNVQNKEIEKSLITILNLISEEAVYRIRISEQNEINFIMSGVYEVLKDEVDVEISDYKENMGSLRILHTILKEELNPYVKKEGSRKAKLRENIDEEFIENYSRRINAYFDLSRIDLKILYLNEYNGLEVGESEGYYGDSKEKKNKTWTQKIYFGPPGTGKSYNVTKEIIEHQKEIGLILDEEDYNSDYVYRTTIYPEYSYYDFIGNIMPIVDKKGVITYDFKPGVFTLALSKALEVSELNIPVYLVIEEISRGNIASIFGDVFQLLDRDETGVSEYKIDNDIIANYLTKRSIAEYKVRYDEESNKKEIYLPSNFNILGTVNTSDQNVFVMDTAFKRRFEFEYVDIAPIRDKETREYLNEFLFHLDDFEYSWNDFYQKLNNYIVSDLELPEDKQIGQFFIKFDKISPEENYKQIQNKLLQYLWEDIHLINITENNLFKEEYKSFSRLYDDFGKHINVFNNKFLESLSREPMKNEELEDYGEDSLENNEEV